MESLVNDEKKTKKKKEEEKGCHKRHHWGGYQMDLRNSLPLAEDHPEVLLNSLAKRKKKNPYAHPQKDPPDEEKDNVLLLVVPPPLLQLLDSQALAQAWLGMIDE